MMGLRRCQFLKWQGHTNKDKSLKYILMPNRTFFKDKKILTLRLERLFVYIWGTLKLIMGRNGSKCEFF